MNEAAVLIVDDEADARNLLIKVLKKEGFLPIAAESGEQAIEEIRKRRFAAILLDYNLQGMNGIQTLEKVLSEDPETQVIMVTAHGSIKLAVEAVRLGAHNFLEKPFDLEEMRIAVKNATKNHQMIRENSRLKDMVMGDRPQPYILGNNPQMKLVWDTVDKVAAADATVLIEGESGTGKEVVAKAIHQKSTRRSGPFIALNCAALSRELIESELFGHVKGAFTGAIDTKKGRFEAADGGTLFLDEIGELALELQAKLLRVLQEGTIERVGDSKTRAVDVRILAATNRDLAEAVRQKSFREDLYYRLHVIGIELPPLRSRKEDVPSLVEFFTAKFAAERGIGLIKISSDAMDFLQRYQYPGNIRELANMIERATLLCSQQVIRVQDLTPMLPTSKIESPGEFATAEKKIVINFAEAKAQFEISHLMHLLTMAQGNVSLAARLAGIDRNNFKDKMRKYGIQSEDFKD